MATKTGNSYITGTTADSVEIPAANLRFSTTFSAKKLTPGDCDNDRQPKIAILNLDAICQSSRDVIISSWGSHISGCRSSLYTYLPTLFYTYIVLYPRFVVGILIGASMASEI